MHVHILYTCTCTVHTPNIPVYKIMSAWRNVCSDTEWSIVAISWCDCPSCLIHAVTTPHMFGVATCYLLFICNVHMYSLFSVKTNFPVHPLTWDALARRPWLQAETSSMTGTSIDPHICQSLSETVHLEQVVQNLSHTHHARAHTHTHRARTHIAHACAHTHISYY